MISTIVYRILQSVGWLALLLSSGVILGTIAGQAIAGPPADMEFLPSRAMSMALVNSVAIGVGAVIVAACIGVPAAVVLVQSRARWLRVSLVAMMLVALLTMPSMHAYAWQLLLTSDGILASLLNRSLVAMDEWGAKGLSAICLGMWLWPIPAGAMVDGLRRSGGEALELAMLDANPLKAMARGVLPMLRGPLFSAAAVVFVAAALDAVVAPLMLASNVWSVEMVREAELAMATPRPAGALFWRSWPMLALVALIAVGAIPGMRRLLAWRSSGAPPQEARRFGGRALAIGGAIPATLAALMPVSVFIVMLAADKRYSMWGAVVGVWRTAQGPAWATTIVALLTAVLSWTIAIAYEIASQGRAGEKRFASRLILIGVLATAVLPATLVATSAVSFYASPQLGSASGWNLYDDTPMAWIAAMLGRYAFVPVCMTALAGLTSPKRLVDQAETDGATRLRAWRTGRWPFVCGASLVGAAIAGLLALTEVQASLLAKAPRWGDDSIAVYLDSQMHYGRHGQTLALALLMYVPIGVVCLGLALQRLRQAKNDSR